MFDLKLVNQDNETLELNYNPYTGDLTQDGLPLFSKGDSKMLGPVGVSPQEPGKKSGDVKRLKIQLGLKCNYSCSYCLQSSEIPDASVTSLDDARSFLSNMDTWLTSAPDKIEFWGGEPLVYWKKLKILVPALREKFPDAEMMMITNGSLLNDEVTDFIIKHDIAIGMSHDGPGHSLRGEDPLLNPEVVRSVKRLMRLGDKFSFQCVITNQAADPNLTVKYFESIFGDSVHVSFEGVVTHYSMDSAKETGLDPGQLSKLTDDVFYGLMSGDGVSRSGAFVGKMQSLVNRITEGSGVGEVKYSKCGMDRPDYLSCDLQGNISTCQNTGVKGRHSVGHVSAIDAAELKSSKHFSRRSKCSQCPVVASCMGSCMYLDGAEFEASCQGEFSLNLGVLKAALFYLTGFVLTSITFKKGKSEDGNAIPLVNI